jgi:membrane protein required for colicin V production
MNYIDIILLIPMAWFAYKGFGKGLIIELFSLIALIAGIYAAVYFSDYAAKFLIGNFTLNEDYVPIISFVITFIGVVVIVYFAGKLLEKLVDMVALGILNKLTGAAFGILKAAVFMSIVIMLINSIDNKWIPKEKKKESVLYSPVSAIAPLLWNKLEDLDINKSTFEKWKEKGKEILEGNDE